MEGTGESARRRTWLSLFIKGVLALAITVAALWFSFKDVDFDEVGPRLSATPASLILVFVLATLAVHVVRVIRWGLLIKPLGPVSNRAIFSAASVGIPASMFLPLRLGEFVRPVMISRSGVPFTGGLASVVVERIADGLANVGLFFTLLAFLPEGAAISPEIRTGSRIALVLFGGGLIVLVVISVLRDPAVRLVVRILTPISETLATKVNDLLTSFLVGLRPLLHPSRAIAFILLTAAYWAINGLALSFVFAGYGIDVPIIAGPFTMSVLVFAVMVPAGPAFAGTMELGFRLGLDVFSVSAESAAVAVIAVHTLQIAIFAIFAGIGFMTTEPAQKGDSEASA